MSVPHRASCDNIKMSGQSGPGQVEAGGNLSVTTGPERRPNPSWPLISTINPREREGGSARGAGVGGGVRPEKERR